MLCLLCLFVYCKAYWSWLINRGINSLNQSVLEGLKLKHTILAFQYLCSSVWNGNDHQSLHSFPRPLRKCQSCRICTPNEGRIGPTNFRNTMSTFFCSDLQYSTSWCPHRYFHRIVKYSCITPIWAINFSKIVPWRNSHSILHNAQDHRPLAGEEQP